MNAIDETREDRLLAALCHASLMTQFVGAIVPLIVWITQKERSAYLRFQALQALIWQAIGMIAYVLFWMVYFVMMMGTFVLAMIISGSPQAAPDASGGILLLPVVFIMCLFPLAGAAGLAYAIIGLVGTGRVLKGYPFRYPVIGRMVERWQARPEQSASPVSASAEGASPL